MVVFTRGLFVKVVIGLVLVRLLLPLIGLKTINWVLTNKLGTYEGHIEDFELSLYRGAYQIQKLEIKKRNTNLAPILTVEEMDLAIAWRALVKGVISIDVQVKRLVLNIIDSKKEENRQYGTEEKNWQEALSALVPLSVQSLILENSAAYFTNQDILKALPIQLEKIALVAEDLQTGAKENHQALSPFTMTAQLQGHAPLTLEGEFDPLAKKPRTDLNFSLVKFHPRTINNMLLAYLPLDLTSGEISIYGEMASANGDMKGYMNVFLNDVDVVAPGQNILSPRHFAIELLGAFANWALRNKDHTTAAHIPFERRKGKFDIDANTAFWSSVENKREKLPKGLENSISLKNLEGTK